MNEYRHVTARWYIRINESEYYVMYRRTFETYLELLAYAKARGWFRLEDITP